MVTEVKELDKYEQMIKESNYLVVDIGATWCGPCKSIKPHFHTLAENLKEKAKLITVDADEGNDICEKEEITQLPTFIVYKNGSKVYNKTGGSTEILNEMRQLIEKSD